MMGTHKHNGFTVIEVMLFLAITGLLIAGVMVGARNNINSQRYRDTVEQFRNVIQGQYDRVYSLTNSDANVDTGSQNPCAQSAAESNKHRGTTNCLYVGRVIELISDASTGTSSVRTSPLIARSNSPQLPPIFGESGSAGGASGNPIRGYSVFRYDQNDQLVDTWQLGWNLSVVSAGTEDRLQQLAIVILRSPLNGGISTHVVNGELSADQAADLSSVVRSSDNRREAKLCVADLQGEIEPPDRMAVVVRAGATGPGDIASLGVEAGC